MSVDFKNQLFQSIKIIPNPNNIREAVAMENSFATAFSYAQALTEFVQLIFIPFLKLKTNR